METNTPEIAEKIKRTLRYSIFDGSFYAAMVGFGESFFSPFAVFLKATSIQLGILSSLPQALGSMFQLASNFITRLFKSRKKMILFCVSLQIMSFIPIIISYYLGANKVTILIIAICIYWIMGMIVNPPWNSWMGDMVEENERGRYFGKREKFVQLVTFISYLSGGYLLQLFTSFKMDFFGFALIFIFAMISRTLSFYYLSKKYEPLSTEVVDKTVSFVGFIKTSLSTNYGKYVLYLCFMNFAVAMSGPYFTPYLLTDLSFKYGAYTLIFGVVIVVKFLMTPVWGFLCDKYGSKKVLAVSGYTMPIIPLLWIFSPSFTYLIIINIISGFTWSGFTISSFNFILDTTNKENRLKFVSYFNVLNGIAMILGAGIGAFVVKYIHVFQYKYFGVFIMSCFIRYLASLIFIPQMKEIRMVEDISHTKLLIKAIRTAPIIGTFYDFILLKK